MWNVPIRGMQPLLLAPILISSGRKEKKKITAMKAWSLQHGTLENKKDSQKIWERKLKNSVGGLEDTVE